MTGPGVEEARTAGLYVSDTAARLSTAVVVAVCVAYAAVNLAGAFSTFDRGDAALCAGCAVGILVLQLSCFSRLGARPSLAVRLVALATMTGLVSLPSAWLGEAYLGFGGFLAGSLLLALPVPVGVPAYLVVVVLAGVVQRRLEGLEPDSLYSVFYAVSATGLTGLVIFALTRLAGFVRQLHDARDELSRLAVAQERLRFARDAHDLLGLSLSAVTVKAEVVDRLVDTDPAAAHAELRELLAVSRRALGEVRMVAAGAAELSLPEELRSARSVLDAAGIDLSVLGVDVELPDEVAALFATMLREAVTNVLRHAKAGACHVAIVRRDEGARLVVTNDGAGGVPDDRAGGAGVANLHRRFAERGGGVSAERDGDEFTLTGRLPV
ncbi:sensor histidine kinase [Actinomycetospora sp. CA-084318]|uniref:sensor histidine kinase n=1 Tax=Actinomycetospora sp. CA-084318 TaxID=3239892 RepID=UPI003D9986A6